MAHINKLAIRGIRSFDDKQISVIEFFTPVTVIVGHNGSGKTTIIECLKYATTGDQPPNTRGGAFIHDPKMANEKEVKAQVKLRFHAANGKRMLAVRNLSVSQKKAGGLTMKTLENILALDNNSEAGGKRAVISTKCAELDAEIPSLLGVSKAVLENVIFCHQEDSYWPLSEPATLKKKFDDIFEATKYTKALDNIKSIRKDRTAELKTEKERLESLQREKAHADKLKSRVVDINSSITAKEVDYDAKVTQYNELANGNKKFYELGSKFRDVYQKVDSLEAQIERLQREKKEAEDSLQFIEGTSHELEERLAGFEKLRKEQNDQLRQAKDLKADLNNSLVESRQRHTACLRELGVLRAEEKAQEARIADRETLIHEICAKQGIKGFDHSPLERDQVLDFLERLSNLQAKQNDETEGLQTQLRQQREQFDEENLKLQRKLAALKSKKESLQIETAKLGRSIMDAERKLEDTDGLSNELSILQSDIESTRGKIKKLKEEQKKSRVDEKIAELQTKIRIAEDEREALNSEMQDLSSQADTRARLDIKRAELKSKKAEVETGLSTHQSKFRRITGAAPEAESMERELDRLHSDKERTIADYERKSSSANSALQTTSNSISQLSSLLRRKQQEIKAMEESLVSELEIEGKTYKSVDAAIEDVMHELSLSQNEASAGSGIIAVWQKLLKQSKKKHVCAACTRPLNNDELKVLEKYAQEQIENGTSTDMAAIQEDIEGWEGHLARLQKLLPKETAVNKLRDVEIPDTELQLKEANASLSTLRQASEEAADHLEKAKSELKEIASLRKSAADISRSCRDMTILQNDIRKLENELASSGSTKTVDDIKAERDALFDQIRTTEREMRTLTTERDRRNQSIQEAERQLHSSELKESKLQNDVQQRNHLQENLAHYKKDLATAKAESKTIDDDITEAQAPIDQLERSYRAAHTELQARFTRSQDQSQHINRDKDKLDSDNRAIQKYVQDKRGRRLKECTELEEQLQQEVGTQEKEAEVAAQSVNRLEREIAAGGSTLANLRENLRARRLQADIETTQAEIETYDLEAAAEAKKNFDTQYASRKKKEDTLHAEFSALSGELSSDRNRLKELERDLKDFKDVQKRYTEQLIKVKMSDMVNSDLEKYAKALDNAIMKYHSLKMEEVNDIMHHLWNKTYQGTDIDGIKIKYDAEGGATKRSYNYRVVMTKDQVEMDMRGRCSAGQKMLASIIIRLALSDSFGQNCGILALDEPTNALDVENIDALAASLVEVINARRGHSNFQLIIITHDENFLAKLGQSEVMDYYWRVTRDARQKSVIERQRFR